jgi:hypothetical protein
MKHDDKAFRDNENGLFLLHKESTKIGRATRESIIIIPADAGGT